MGFGQTGRVQRGSLLRHELGTPADWHGAVSDARGSVCSGRLHQPTLEPAPEPRAASDLERRTVVACPPAGATDADPFVQPVDRPAARTARLARVCAVVPSASRTGCADAQRVSCACRGNGFPSHQRPTAVALDRAGGRLVPGGGTHRRDGLAGVVRRIQKKETPSYRVNRCVGWNTLRWKIAIGLAFVASRTFANAAGGHRLANGNSRLLRATTKLCSGCCPWSACQLNGCSSRCALGSSRHSRIRKINWAWVRYSSTACG